MDGMDWTDWMDEMGRKDASARDLRGFRSAFIRVYPRPPVRRFQSAGVN